MSAPNATGAHAGPGDMHAAHAGHDRGLQAMLDGSPYAGYAYSYPHKSSYRPLVPPVPLDQAWAGEDRGNLFLYLHLPFCEMRCGFCNLFTVAKPRGGPDGDLVTAYLDALERHARQVRQAIAPASFARMAIGGGTPTYLPPDSLHRLFDIAGSLLDGSPPTSVETSPETGTSERLAVLRDRGVTRVSIGVQSFVDDEVRAVGRAQRASQVAETLERIQDMGFATLNIDLMYGLPGQTRATWLASIDRALEFAPGELFLYPLYVRPLTGMGRRSQHTGLDSQVRDPAWDAERLALYRAGRDHLLERGFRQVSMRLFRAAGPDRGGGAPGDDFRETGEAPAYRCQEDGMVGLGAGARSYTDRLHYSSDYAVSARGVRGIIADYCDRSEDGFRTIDHGVQLDDEDRRRRHVILSILHRDGLDLAGYRQRFGRDAVDDMPELGALEKAGLARRVEREESDACDAPGARAEPAARGQVLILTGPGIELSDAIGPWLRSARVRQLSVGFELR